MPNIEQEALRLDYPAYHAEPRRGWGGYTRRVSVMRVMDPAGGRRLLRRYMPGLTAEQHRSIARGHIQLALEHRQEWSDTADEAAQAAFGRPFGFHDYRVSGIGRDEFSEPHKERLRKHAHSEGDHHRLAILHLMAAGHRHQTALGLCREAGL